MKTMNRPDRCSLIWLVACYQLMFVNSSILAEPSHQKSQNQFNKLMANSYSNRAKLIASPITTPAATKPETSDHGPNSANQPTTSASVIASVKTPNSTWIDTILIRVESLDIGGVQGEEEPRENAKNQPIESVTAIDFDEQTLETASSSSLAPTDTLDEDQIDSTTTSPNHNITQTSNFSPATQYTIATDQDPVSPAQEEERKLVETNNVIAVLDPKLNTATTDKTLSSQFDQESKQDKSNTTSSVTTPNHLPPMSCERAYNKCALRDACAPALRRYNDDCRDLINGSQNQCSPNCLRAMVALGSSEEGGDLVNCDCRGNEFCILSKQRSEVCRHQVEQAIDPKTVVTCSTASSICLANHSCSIALDYYYRFCQSLFSQQICSPRCNNSLSILYRQPKASKLINCQCDGTEEFPCSRYKTYTERFCLNKPTSNFQIDFADDHHNNHSQADDYNINLTKETELSFDGTPLSNDKEDYEDEPKSADDGGIDERGIDESGDNSMSSEDNWIPLISGWYFSNLYHRQERSRKLTKQESSQHIQSGPRSDTTQRARRREQYYSRNGEGVAGGGGEGSNRRNHIGRNSRGRAYQPAMLGSRSGSSQPISNIQVQILVVSLTLSWLVSQHNSIS